MSNFFSTQPILEDQEDRIIPLYCGPKNMKPSLNIIAYTPIRYLHEKDFILSHPSNYETYGKTHIDVVIDEIYDKHYKMVHV
jgi:hypothetical protein